MPKFCYIYITNPDEATARKITNHLLKKKLIACVNMFNISSIYPWKGKVADEKEVVLIAKTLAGNYAKVKGEVEKIHPYTIPCIAQIPVSFNTKYAKWLEETIKG